MSGHGISAQSDGVAASPIMTLLNELKQIAADPDLLDDDGMLEQLVNGITQIARMPPQDWHDLLLQLKVLQEISAATIQADQRQVSINDYRRMAAAAFFISENAERLIEEVTGNTIEGFCLARNAKH